MAKSSNGIPYNVKVFHYASGTQIRLYDKPLVKGAEKEKSVDLDLDNNYFSDEQYSVQKKNASAYSSRNRTIQSIYGIARSNMWDWFITLTFDRNLVDSSDYSLVTSKASKWCNNLRSRVSPNMIYLLVPELHADGKHWHIHGLFSNCPEISFFKTDIVKNGKTIYNLTNWKYGFSTATKVEHSGRVSSYITKYITKELCERSLHKRRYWASKNAFRANDVLTIDLLSNEEKQKLLLDLGNSVESIKRQKCDKSGQVVTYIELGDSYVS